MDIDVADADTDSVTNALGALIKEHMDEDETGCGDAKDVQQTEDWVKLKFERELETLKSET